MLSALGFARHGSGQQQLEGRAQGEPISRAMTEGGGRIIVTPGELQSLAAIWNAAPGNRA